jgi:cell division protein FtsB
VTNTKRWLVVYLGALAVLFSLSALHEGGLRRHRRLSADARRVAEDNARLRDEIQRLRREARAMAGDPSALERAAREELGYVRPGEVVYEWTPDGARR